MCFKMFVITFMQIKITYVEIDLYKYLVVDIVDSNVK